MLIEKLNDKLYRVIAKFNSVAGYRMSVDTYADYRRIEGRTEKEIRSFMNWYVTIQNIEGNFILERKPYRSYNSAYNAYKKIISSFENCEL